MPDEESPGVQRNAEPPDIVGGLVEQVPDLRFPYAGRSAYEPVRLRRLPLPRSAGRGKKPEPHVVLVVYGLQVLPVNKDRDMRC